MAIIVSVATLGSFMTDCATVENSNLENVVKTSSGVLPPRFQSIYFCNIFVPNLFDNIFFVVRLFYLVFKVLYESYSKKRELSGVTMIIKFSVKQLLLNMPR